jgi:hypothetical protein
MCEHEATGCLVPHCVSKPMRAHGAILHVLVYVFECTKPFVGSGAALLVLHCVEMPMCEQGATGCLVPHCVSKPM